MTYVEKKDPGPKTDDSQKKLDHGTENEVIYFFKIPFVK